MVVNDAGGDHHVIWGCSGVNYDVRGEGDYIVLLKVEKMKKTLSGEED